MANDFDGFFTDTKLTTEIPGVRFGGDVRVFVPRHTAPFSGSRALGIAGCAQPGAGSELQMLFEPAVSAVSVRAGVDDRAAPAGGTYARLVAYDKDGRRVADSGDVKIAEGGSVAALVTPLAVSSSGDIASAVVVSGTGTISHDTGARCVALDNLEVRVPVAALIGPSVVIDTPVDGQVFPEGGVRVSGQVFAPDGMQAFCLTVDFVTTFPAGCNLVTPFGVSEVGPGGFFRNVVPPPMSPGTHTVAAWVMDNRGQVGRTSVIVRVVGGPAQYDMRVRGIEVTQGIQRFELPGFFLRGTVPGLGDSIPFAVYNGVRLAAGSATIVRVFAGADYPESFGLFREGSSARLYGYRVGTSPMTPRTELAGSPLLPEDVGTVTLRRGPDSVTRDERSDIGGAFDFVIPAGWARGTIILVAEVLPPGVAEQPGFREVIAANNRAGVAGIEFTPMRNYTIAPVQLASTFAPNRVPPTDPAPLFSGLRAVLPLGEGQLRVLPWQGVVDVTPIDRCNAEDQRTMRCFMPNDKDWDLVRVTGAFDLARRLPGQAYGISWGVGGGRTIGRYAMAEGTQNRPLTAVAHEALHLLARPHAGRACVADGVSWPPDDRGHLQGVATDRRRNVPSSRPFSRILYANPDPTARPQYYDIQSYCLNTNDRDSWISVRHWTEVLGLLREGGPAWPGVGTPPAPTSLLRVDAPTLRVTAVVSEHGGAGIASVEPGDGAVSTPFADPRYRFVVRNAAGAVVSDTPVAPETAERHPGHASAMVFVARVPAPAAAAVELMADGVVVARAARSGRAPTVSVLSPSAGARLSGRGTVLVRWQARDADSDPMTSRIEYVVGARRRTLYAGPSRGTVRLPARLFTRASRARIQVTVNDGFNQTVASSGVFRSVGSPPTVRITAPAPGRRIDNDASLYLSGEAYDGESRPLAGGRLRWFSGSRPLGRGGVLSVNGLGAGRHRIRLVARDRDGRVVTRTIPVRVVAVPPQFTVLRAPARVAASARRVRITVASALPGRLALAGRRHVVDRRPRAISIPVSPGSGTLTIRAALTVERRTLVRTLRIERGT